MDNYLGVGWEKIDLTQFLTQRMVYALTRHVVVDDTTCTSKMLNHLKRSACNPGVSYIGSHDTFVFYSDRQFLEKDLLTDLSISQTSNGMENVMIWYFRTELGFKVINPCIHVNNVCYTAILQYIAVCFLNEAIICQTGHTALATM